MSAVLFAAFAGALFGALAVAVRYGLRRGADPEVGAVVLAGVALCVSAVVAIPAAVAHGVHPGDLWPFLLIGALVPGASQILFILAVRDAGPSRAAILIGTAPLMSVAIALALLGEPFRPLLLLGTALVVAGGVALARERSRPSCSNWRQAIVPVASSSRIWSTARSISSAELEARCSEMILSVSVLGPVTVRA